MYFYSKIISNAFFYYPWQKKIVELAHLEDVYLDFFFIEHWIIIPLI